MAEFSPTEITKLIQALQQPGGFDAALQDALSILSAAKDAPALPKEQKAIANILLKLVPQRLQAELRQNIASGDVGVALAKLQANKDILQLRIAGGVDLEQAKGARQIAVGEAKVEQDVLRKQLLGEAEIELEAKRAAAAIPAVDPVVQAFIDKEEAQLQAILRDKKTPLPPEDILNSRIDALKVEGTNGVQKASLLNAERTLRQQEAHTLTQRLLAEKAPRATAIGATQGLLTDAAASGIAATDEAVLAVERGALAAEQQAQRLADVGVQVKRDGGRLQLVEGALQPEEPTRRFLPEGPTEKVRKLVEQAEAARLAGDPVTEAKIRKSIPGGRLKAGLGRGGAIAGGLAALLLLPKLLGGGGNEQAQSAQAQALQLQLLQQAQASQNQNALTQSLVQSRGSQSGLNDARTQLLQLQALQAAGGGGGGLV